MLYLIQFEFIKWNFFFFYIHGYNYMLNTFEICNPILNYMFYFDDAHKCNATKIISQYKL